MMHLLSLIWENEVNLSRLQLNISNAWEDFTWIFIMVNIVLISLSGSFSASVPWTTVSILELSSSDSIIIRIILGILVLSSISSFPVISSWSQTMWLFQWLFYSSWWYKYITFSPLNLSRSSSTGHLKSLRLCLAVNSVSSLFPSLSLLLLYPYGWRDSSKLD